MLLAYDRYDPSEIARSNSDGFSDIPSYVFAERKKKEKSASYALGAYAGTIYTE